MGRHTDRKPLRDGEKGFRKSQFGRDRKSFKKNNKSRDRLSAFQYHNYSRDPDSPPRARERFPAKVSTSGKFRVEREDGTSYEINKDLLK